MGPWPKQQQNRCTTPHYRTRTRHPLPNTAFVHAHVSSVCVNGVYPGWLLYSDVQTKKQREDGVAEMMEIASDLKMQVGTGRLHLRECMHGCIFRHGCWLLPRSSPAPLPSCSRSS